MDKKTNCGSHNKQEKSGEVIYVVKLVIPGVQKKTEPKNKALTP